MIFLRVDTCGGERDLLNSTYTGMNGFFPLEICLKPKLSQFYTDINGIYNI
jgi:hypothetical protein